MSEARSFYRMLAKSGKKAEIYIYGTIGRDWWDDGSAVLAHRFVKDLKALGDVEELIININSPGGSVYEGNAIYNALKAHKATKTVHIQGLAASMGSVIAMVGDKIIMPKNAMMMIHNPATCACGDARDFRKLADVLDKIKDGLIEAYAEKTGKTAEEISALMDDETWMNAKEAVELGFADEIAEEVEITARFDLSRFRNVPAEFLAVCGIPDEPEPAQIQAGDTVVLEGIPGMEGASTVSTNTHHKKEEPMDLETLKAENPELLAKLMADAARQERERVASIQKAAALCPGHDELVNAMILDGTSAEQAALKLLEAEASRKNAALSTIEKNAAKPAPQPAVDSQAKEEEVVTEETPVAKAAPDSDDFEKQLKERWNADASLRQEFSSFSSYRAFSKAEAEGRVKLLTKE